MLVHTLERGVARSLCKLQLSISDIAGDRNLLYINDAVCWSSDATFLYVLDDCGNVSQPPTHLNRELRNAGLLICHGTVGAILQSHVLGVTPGLGPAAWAPDGSLLACLISLRSNHATNVMHILIFAEQ